MKYSCHVYYSFVWFWCTFIWLLYDFHGLTYWPSAQCQLLFSACFWFSRKSISNEVQIQRNFLTIFSGRKQTQEAFEEQQKSHRGPTSHLGMPAPQARPGASWALGGPPPVGLGSSIFYLFHKKISKKFHPITGTFISAQKTTTWQFCWKQRQSGLVLIKSYQNHIELL